MRNGEAKKKLKMIAVCCQKLFYENQMRKWMNWECFGKFMLDSWYFKWCNRKMRVIGINSAYEIPHSMSFISRLLCSCFISLSFLFLFVGWKTYFSVSVLIRESKTQKHPQVIWEFCSIFILSNFPKFRNVGPQQKQKREEKKNQKYFLMFRFKFDRANFRVFLLILFHQYQVRHNNTIASHLFENFSCVCGFSFLFIVFSGKTFVATNAHKHTKYYDCNDKTRGIQERERDRKD